MSAFGEGIVKAAKMFGRGTVHATKEGYDALNMYTKPLHKAADGVAWGMEKTAVGTFKALTKDEEKKFTNFYTGKGISGFGKVAFPVAGAAIGYGMFVDKTAFGPKPGKVSYNGEPEVMAADGIANTAAPTLGATGNMVFGLHNSRKG